MRQNKNYKKWEKKYDERKAKIEDVLHGLILGNPDNPCSVAEIFEQLMTFGYQLDDEGNKEKVNIAKDIAFHLSENEGYAIIRTNTMQEKENLRDWTEKHLFPCVNDQNKSILF